ncbi:Uncharacterised protein [Streptococcus pneumoniae]|nr:Uncharacterised protein [Streptococcus pneumoniae]
MVFRLGVNNWGLNFDRLYFLINMTNIVNTNPFNQFISYLN